MQLSDKMKRFAANRAGGLSQRDSAVAAGYLSQSPNSLAVTAHRLDSDPRIQRLTFELRERRLQGMACKALNTLESILDDPIAPHAAKIQAVKLILSASGHTLEAKLAAIRHPADTDKPISEMTLGELENAIRSAEANLARARGIVVEAETQTDGDDTA